MWRVTSTTPPLPNICEFFCLKVYRTATPGPDVKPHFRRSMSLESYENNISFYLPNKLLGWNVETKAGNPTRSISVNQLIQDVTKAEVQRWGKSTCTRRPLEYDKFEKLMRMLWGDTFVSLCFMSFITQPKWTKMENWIVSQQSISRQPEQRGECQTFWRAKYSWMRNLQVYSKGGKEWDSRDL